MQIRRLWIVPCLALCACAGDLAHPERFAFLIPDGGPDAGAVNLVPPPSCVTDLFENSCGSAACHGPGTKLVDLTSPGVEKRLINRSSSKDSVCSGRTYIATNGEQSLLLQKLTTPPCGQQMPYGGMATAEDVACVRDWISVVNGGGLSGDGGAGSSSGDAATGMGMMDAGMKDAGGL
ncbi:MAG TPA: hypothetical protein VHM19_17765 [Polyangiales bacterium]|nr:hypothetical protein [Polyangiales bacterium]